jgi:hypothetical protein
MDAGLLDRLIKLASLGASGVCIFAIFWIGWLILRLPEGATKDWHMTLRIFMVITVAIALISGATGLVNAKFNADDIAKLEHDKKELQTEFGAYKADAAEKIARHVTREIEMREAAHALAEVLKSKEAYALRFPSPEIQTHIELLKAFLTKLGISIDDR